MKSTILVLTSTFPRNDQDYEPRFVADLCIQLSKLFKIVVVTQRRPGTLTRENYHGIEVIRYRYAPAKLEILSETGGMLTTLSKNPLAWLLVPGLLLCQILACRRVIKRENPAAIHAHWLVPQTLAAILSQALIGDKIPVVATSHGADLYGLRGGMLTWLKKRIVNSCNTFCVVSSAMQNYACSNLGIDASNAGVCPMGVDLESRFIPGETEIRAMGQLLFVGRLVSKKGVKYLLHALKKLRKIDPGFNLVIAGYGPEEQNLHMLAIELKLQEAVSFRGSVSHQEIAALYQQSEVCVFPFTETRDGDVEGLGLVVVEAMGCKCPVIVGNVPAISDIVVDQHTGLICDPESSSGIFDSIMKLRNDADLKYSLVENAYNHVHSRYSWPACADRYSEIFKSLS